LAFKASPYRWPIIGWMADIERIDATELRAFYDTYYRPNNAVLIVVGDVKAPDVLARVRRYFGAIPRGATPPAVTAIEPPHIDERRLVLRKEGAQLPVVNIAWHVPNHTSPDAPALELLSQLLSEGRASRLYRGLVYEKRMVLGAGGEYSYSSIDPSLFWFYAAARGGAAQAGAGARRGAGAGAQPDRGLVRLAAGLGVLPLLGAGPLRDPRVLAPPRGLPAEAAGGHPGRRATGRANLLRGGPQERVDPAARAGARGGPVSPARGSRLV